jgi:hypothetical protein
VRQHPGLTWNNHERHLITPRIAETSLDDFRSISTHENCNIISPLQSSITTNNFYKMSPREPNFTLINSRPESCESLTEFVGKDQPSNERSVPFMPSPKKSVSFDSVTVREYNRVIGDHPEVKVGPPVSLGWEYLQLPEQSLEEYHESKPERRSLRLSSITRKNLLLNVFGYSEEEIRAAEKEVQVIRKKREQSRKQGKAGIVVESAMQSARRRFRRSFSGDVFQGFAAVSSHMMPFPLQV